MDYIYWLYKMESRLKYYLSKQSNASIDENRINFKFNL
jgi:hypothetical protein